MEVEASGRAAINLLEPWKGRTTLKCHDGITVKALELASRDAFRVPRGSSSDPILEAILKGEGFNGLQEDKDANVSDLPTKMALRQALMLPPPEQPVAPAIKFKFHVPSGTAKPLEIRPKPCPVAPHGVKRRRLASDVDGPITADLTSKKRRLRADLITSRLSQPYSQPATHILNREGQESGDKRFLKMSTSLDVARRLAHLHSTSFLRYSMMNCLRKRLGLGQHGPTPRRQDEESATVVEKSSPRSQWEPTSLEASSAGKSLRIHTAPSHGQHHHQPASPLSTSSLASPTSSSHSSPHSKRQSSTSPKPTQPIPTACRLSQPAALPRPALDVLAMKRRTSPRIYPVRSPEIKPALESLEELEEDSFAFLHPTEDDWDEQSDDQEGVYSDFGALFGQAPPAGATETTDERTYEEYLDELDGICWVSR